MLALLPAPPAMAEVDLPRAEACFAQALADKTDPATCIDAEQAACMTGAQETPAVATLCFSQAQASWSGAVAARMQAVQSGAGETLATIVRIETKYDLLSALIQCDRVEELSLAASDLPGAAIAVQKARCQATASGLTYLWLHLRARDIP